MSSLQNLVKLFESKDPEFDINKLAISDPYLSEDNDAQYNTYIVIKPKDALSGYLGTKTFPYNRKDLGILFHQIKPMIDLRGITEVAPLIHAINNQYGLTLFADEVEITEISLENGVTVKAKATNYEYIGQVTFHHALPLIKTKEIQLDGFKYPEETNRAFASIYGLNLGELQYNVIKTYREHQPFNREFLAKILSSLSNDKWVVDSTPAEYNLYQAEIEKVEEKEELGIVTRFVTIKLNTELSTALSQYLTLTTKYKKATLSETCKQVFDDRLRLYQPYVKLDQANVTQVNELLVQKNIPESIDRQWTIVYNGRTSQLPEVFTHLVCQDTENLCILMNGYDKTKPVMVFSY